MVTAAIFPVTEESIRHVGFRHEVYMGDAMFTTYVLGFNDDSCKLLSKPSSNISGPSPLGDSFCDKRTITTVLTLFLLLITYYSCKAVIFSTIGDSNYFSMFRYFHNVRYGDKY